MDDAEIKRRFWRGWNILKRARLAVQVDRRSGVVLGGPLDVDDHALDLRSAERLQLAIVFGAKRRSCVSLHEFVFGRLI